MFGPVEPLTAADLPGCMALAVDRAWTAEEHKWRLLFELGTVYGVRDETGAPAGVVVLTRYGEDLAAIGMMLVAARYGRQGIGRRIMTHVLAEADGATVFLNATTMGRPLYERLGFVPVGSTHTFAGELAVPPGHEPTSRPAEPGDLAAIRRLDAQANGVDRPRLVRFLPGFTEQLRVIEHDGGIAGYAGGWRNTDGLNIGPVIADRAEDAAALIADVAAAAAGGGPVRIDLGGQHPRLSEWAAGHGLALRRIEPVMMHGGTALPGDRSRWFASLMQATG
ncbi:MAG TPA: GNAT family N-acetyltransferase [Streptosporangiaceae bacterium]|nr:GNAT family N-acetyltransferase [Streptosporangiaceae bacterium]